MSHPVQAFQGKSDLWSSQPKLPRETPLFTVQFRCESRRKNERPRLRFLYAASKSEALKLVERLHDGDYIGADGNPVNVTSDIDVLKTQTRLIHTTREECDEDDDEERAFDPRND